tara:strand:+ start:19077 stop:19529 length:453 start_codon:yes stop_codon:yes gene_type:complete
MIDDFIVKLKGKYNNWLQAASSPRDYSHVHIIWDQIGDNELTIKQWYDHEGESNPYRTRWHKILENQNSIIVENWEENWKEHHNQYDMMFTLNNNFYKGKLIHENPTVRENTILKSFVEFNGDKYRSRDQGWRGNELIWGSMLIYELQKE